MLDPFIGQLALFPFGFAPAGWAPCEGQLLSIAQNTALFSLLGTRYGGDGRVTFALPDLRGRVPNGQGAGAGLQPYAIGDTGGAERVALTAATMPAHGHPLVALAVSATTGTAAGALLAEGHGGGGRGAYTVNTYAASGTRTALAPAQIGNAGGNAPHDNLQPYLTLRWCIALQGVYPSRP